MIHSDRSHGFTLVELVTVLVVLSILSVVGTRFVVLAAQSYDITQKRLNLIAQGRLTTEQLNRYLRRAVPNAIRISASGNCIEYFPVVAGGNYIGNLPNTENGSPAIASITTSPLAVSLGNARHVMIGALSAAEAYTFTSPASRVSVASTSGSPITQVNFTSSHRFIRGSINQRIFLADNPERFCVQGSELFHYSNYGVLTSTLSDGNPGGDSVLMARSVVANGAAFSLSPASEDRNTAIQMALIFSGGSQQATINHQVLVRNVP